MDFITGLFMSGVYSLIDYLSLHVVTCLIPALFIAGAISSVFSQAAILKYFGPKANKVMSYAVASVSGTVLAVCSCTVLPLFGGIYKRGAGLGPAIAFLYSTPPLRLKQYVGLSSGLIAFASLMVTMAGFVCSGERALAQFPSPVLWYCLTALTCGVNFKDIKDYEGDRRAGMQTIVTLFGLRAGKIIIAVLVAVGFFMAPWIFHRADLWVPSLIFAAVAAFIITRPHFRETRMFLLYYAYFLVLLAVGLFRNLK